MHSYSSPINIIIADDHRIFRRGFRSILVGHQDINILGETENGRELLAMMQNSIPDVVFLDIQMPLMDGVTTCKMITDRYPEVGIIALSMFGDDDSIIRMLSAGARGFLLKNTDQEEIILAARQVSNNGRYYCTRVTDRITKMIAEGAYNPYNNLPPTQLTDREKEIMKLVCQQLTNKEIACKLGLSIRTIESHQDSIMIKTGSRNMIGFVIYAISNGLL